MAALNPDGGAYLGSLRHSPKQPKRTKDDDREERRNYQRDDESGRRILSGVRGRRWRVDLAATAVADNAGDLRRGHGGSARNIHGDDERTNREKREKRTDDASVHAHILAGLGRPGERRRADTAAIGLVSGVHAPDLPPNREVRDDNGGLPSGVGDRVVKQFDPAARAPRIGG
jgi:hypothetical protein